TNRPQEGKKCFPVGQGCELAREDQFPGAEQSLQTVPNFGPESQLQHGDGHEKVWSRIDPACLVRGDASARHDAMDVRVKREERMMTEVLYHPKIKPEHLARKAVVYLRQSSDKQVRQNKESQHLQYAVAERVRALGWNQVEVSFENCGVCVRHSNG